MLEKVDFGPGKHGWYGLDKTTATTLNDEVRLAAPVRRVAMHGDFDAVIALVESIGPSLDAHL